MKTNLLSDFISTSGLSLELILQYSQCDYHSWVLFRPLWGKWLQSLSVHLHILNQIFLSRKLSKRIPWWRLDCKIKVLVYRNGGVFQYRNQVKTACKHLVHPSQICFSITCFSVSSHIPSHGALLCLSATQSSGRISSWLFSSSRNFVILLQSWPEPLCLTLNNSSTVL